MVRLPFGLGRTPQAQPRLGCGSCRPNHRSQIRDGALGPPSDLGGRHTANDEPAERPSTARGARSITAGAVATGWAWGSAGDIICAPALVQGIECHAGPGMLLGP